MEDEKKINYSPDPVSISGTEKILEQMKNCICKIKINNAYGTGFFCKIPFINKSKKEEKMNVFMTNHHVLNDNDYKNNEEIYLFLNDDKIVKTLKSEKERKTYFNKEYDISIIELKDNDNINNFLELDENLFKEEINAYFRDISIYILQYRYGNKAEVSYGFSTLMNNNEINHRCSTEKGSSGSPILNLSNNKVIGIHKNHSIYFNYNIGTLLKYP